ncbi:MAG: efflux RND transporter permease subunit [Natronomonas sp.]
MTGGRDGPVDYDRYVSWVDDRIVSDSQRVVVTFLVVTLVFVGGLGAIQTEAGTEQFAEEIPANEALEQINDELGPRFEADTGSTQLIQRDRNVLSKPALLDMLEVQYRLEQREGLRVAGSRSAASTIAQEIDPSATTLDEQRRTIEIATTTQIQAAVRENADNAGFTGTLSTDFNAKSASASATIGVVTHDIPKYSSGGAGQGGESSLTPIQTQAQDVVDGTGGDITVFGDGTISAEFNSVIADSLTIVVPAALITIVLLLAISYRDPLDLLLGVIALLITVVWTFGSLGLVGIPFNQMMIAVPPLLLAVGIDFGIHAINRYREERAVGFDIPDSMRLTTHQLLVAYFIVTGTTVIGFLANLSSDLQPIRDFGLVAAIGITFTFLIFGIFLPAAKVWIDRRRSGWAIPTFSQRPLGSEGSALATVLGVGVVAARRAPIVVIVIALVGGIAVGGYAIDVDTSFSDEDFLPPEETPAYLELLPQSLQPDEYTVVAQLNFLEDNFETVQGSTTTVYVEGRMTDDTALEELHRAGEDPPDSFVTTDRKAQSTSIITVIQDRAEIDPEFRAVVDRNDRDGNGIPDRNLGEVYDALFATGAAADAERYLADDRRSTRVDYDVTADATNEEVTADTRAMASKHPFMATATGSTVVFQVISNLILDSAIQSLAIALTGTALFLIVVYWVTNGYPSLGVVNVAPMALSVVLIAGSMRLLGISFNAFTASILALTIGLGIDYSVHVVHRYVDERRRRGLVASLDRAVRGTGGALTGSMLTTSLGIGVLVLAVLDVLGQFGILTALSVVYSYLVSLLILPSVLVLWDRYAADDPEVPLDETAQ